MSRDLSLVGGDTRQAFVNVSTCSRKMKSAAMSPPFFAGESENLAGFSNSQHKFMADGSPPIGRAVAARPWLRKGICMYSQRKRKLLCFLLILPILLFGMCLDNVQTDSFLGYSETASGEGLSAGPVHAGSASAYRSVRKVSTEQAYMPKTLRTGDTVFAPRQAVRKSGIRICRCGFSAANAIDALPLLFPPAFGSYSHILFCEIISNTVILDYIHRQDGQKEIS